MTRLAAYDEALRGMSMAEQRNFAQYMLGFVSEAVAREEWDAGLAWAARMARS